MDIDVILRYSIVDKCVLCATIIPHNYGFCLTDLLAYTFQS